MIFRLLFYLFLAWAIYYVMTTFFKGKGGGREQDRKSFEGELKACPECHTYFPPDSGLVKKVDGARLLFCGPDCVARFMDRKKSEEA